MFNSAEAKPYKKSLGKTDFPVNLLQDSLMIQYGVRKQHQIVHYTSESFFFFKSHSERQELKADPL